MALRASSCRRLDDTAQPRSHHLLQLRGRAGGFQSLRSALPAVLYTTLRVPGSGSSPHTHTHADPRHVCTQSEVLRMQGLYLGARPSEHVRAVSVPSRSASGTSPSPYCLKRYEMMSSLSYICGGHLLMVSVRWAVLLAAGCCSADADAASCGPANGSCQHSVCTACDPYDLHPWHCLLEAAPREQPGDTERYAHPSVNNTRPGQPAGKPRASQGTRHPTHTTGAGWAVPHLSPPPSPCPRPSQPAS